jgi:hypothetical protein
MAVRPLPPGVDGAYQRRGDRRAIVLSRTLGRAGRNAALAHELVHDERGGGAAYRGQPAGWAAVVARDEHQVDDEVARRLVPAGDLARLWTKARGVNGTLAASEVAAAFDVPTEVAARALILGMARRRRRRPRRGATASG